MTKQTPDIRLSFNKVPDLYDQIRPLYPAKTFNELFRLLPQEPKIVEVGPGTGQATGELLKHSSEVTAVEIGPDLAALLESKYADHDNLTVINSPLEEAGVTPHTFDAFVSVCAYHWIKGEDRLDIPAKLLKKGGVMAIIDLTQVESEADKGYFKRVHEIYDRYGQGKSQQLPTLQTLDPSAHQEMYADERFSKPQLHMTSWNQTYSADEYGDLLRTYSGMQMMKADEREALIQELTDVIRVEFDDLVTRPLVVAMSSANLQQG